MRRLATFLFVSLAFAIAIGTGCHPAKQRMDHPEDPNGRYKTQISAAKRLLEQKESWADRAEWEVQPHGDRYDVIAWRVEYPEKKGAMRYLPWGYSVIVVDNRGQCIDYHRKR